MIIWERAVTLCPLCGGQLRVIADITQPELITKILNHIQNRDPPRPSPRRALPHYDPNDRFAERCNVRGESRLCASIYQRSLGTR